MAEHDEMVSIEREEHIDKVYNNYVAYILQTIVQNICGLIL